MAYQLAYAPAVARDFARLPPEVLRRIDTKILALADNPRPRGARKLKDESGLWRVRVGEYRVLYAVDDTAELVTIARARHRRDAYR